MSFGAVVVGTGFGCLTHVRAMRAAGFDVVGLVGDVARPSPADKAGLKQGDVITGFAGEKVQDGSSFRLKVATSDVGKPYELDYLREGKKRSTTIVPAPAEKVVFDIEREGKSGEKPGSTQPAKTTINAFGLEVRAEAGHIDDGNVGRCWILK